MYNSMNCSLKSETSELRGASIAGIETASSNPRYARTVWAHLNSFRSARDLKKLQWDCNLANGVLQAAKCVYEGYNDAVCTHQLGMNKDIAVWFYTNWSGGPFSCNTLVDSWIKDAAALKAISNRDASRGAVTVYGTSDDLVVVFAYKSFCANSPDEAESETNSQLNTSTNVIRNDSDRMYRLDADYSKIRISDIIEETSKPCEEPSVRSAAQRTWGMNSGPPYR